MKKQPLVSVIMPVHNAGRFLVPAIESILTQTYKPIELIIVDDGSTDQSWKTMRSYRNANTKTVRIYKTPKQLNSAGNGATELGLSHAKGVFMARMDADDVAYKRRIEKQVAYLIYHSDTIMVGSQATVIDKTGRIVGEKTVPTNHEAIYWQYGIVHPMIHPSVMIRRSLLPDPNKIYMHKWGVNDDYSSFFRLLSYGRFANLPEPLLKYRVHEGNSSLQHIKSMFWNITMIRFEAITKGGYRAPFILLPVMALQAFIVLLLPEPVLRELFYYLRGMKRPMIKLPYFSFPPMWAKMKQYALSLR